MNFVVIKTFSKYLFGLLVASYIVTVIGVPVYLHYCGGRLESVNYVNKASSCCGDNENNSAEDSGCCSNQDYFVQNHAAFVNKPIVFTNQFNLLSTAFLMLPFNAKLESVFHPELFQNESQPPPGVAISSRVVSVSVLRI